MDTMEIPAGTFSGKAIVVACSALIIVAILAWGVPKFRVFLAVVFGRAPRKPGTRNIHLALGFVVYALVFAPVVIATFIGVGMATARPTVLSSQGISGGQLNCNSDFSIVFFSCTSPFRAPGHSEELLQWEQIEKVDCISRSDGTIRELYINAGTRRIEIGSLAVYDLTAAHQFILEHAPNAAVRACQVPLG